MCLIARVALISAGYRYKYWMYLYNSLAPLMNEMHLRSSIFVCLHACLRRYKRSRGAQWMESESQYGSGTEWGIDRMGNELLASDRFEYIDTGMEGRWQKEIVWFLFFSSAHRSRTSLTREGVFLHLQKGYVVLGMRSLLRKSVCTGAVGEQNMGLGLMGN